VNRRLVRVVGRPAIPPHAPSFALFRAGTPHPITKRVERWWFWNGEESWPVGDITPEQRKMPLRFATNHAGLVHLIVTDWTPEADRRYRPSRGARRVRDHRPRAGGERGCRCGRDPRWHAPPRHAPRAEVHWRVTGVEFVDSLAVAESHLGLVRADTLPLDDLRRLLPPGSVVVPSGSRWIVGEHLTGACGHPGAFGDSAD
jgi:hypothetical protein